MGLAFIGASAGVSSASLPDGWQPGDLAIVFAYRDGSTTPPSLASGWTNVINGGSNTNSQRVGRRTLQSGDTGTGTWTNATTVICLVYRGQDADTPVGASAQGGGASTTVTYPALTLQRTDGSSWVLCAAGHRSTNTALETPPTGTTLRHNEQDATDEASAFDTDGGVASWSSQVVSVGGSSSGWRAVSIEIREQPAQEQFGAAILEAEAIARGAPRASWGAVAVIHAEAIQSALARLGAAGQAVFSAEALLQTSARGLFGGRGELVAEALLGAYGYASAGPTPVRLLRRGMRRY